MELDKHHPATLSRRRVEPVYWAMWGVGLSLAAILRISLFNFESPDYRYFLSPWYDYIVNNGGFRALGHRFSNYTPPYLYLLALATYLPLSKLYAIKLISVLFDFLLASVVLLAVRQRYDSRVVWMLSFFAALFAPTVFFNSALWGQCDVIYTAMLITSIYFVLRREPNLALFFFGVALSFKLQAIFLFPLFVVLLLKRHIPIYSFLIIPATYVLMMLPAWVAGRPLLGLLLIYRAQAGTYESLTLEAPNLYQWLPDNPELFRMPGLILAASLVYLLCLACYLSGVKLDEGIVIKLSLASVLLLPFTLPHMHERYFFAADVIAIIYAFYSPERFFIPILVGAASLFSYFPFLFDQAIFGLEYMAILMGIALVVVTVDLLSSLYPDLVTNSTPSAARGSMPMR
ncbi:hypothetical protein BH24GEM3_BH24GEM3_11370 [soil metagenome]|jgi:Gpi18-like mannosyltransferase|nr:hypothetical protein [Gemmatimonadota bacterium]